MGLALSRDSAPFSLNALNESFIVSSSSPPFAGGGDACPWQRLVGNPECLPVSPECCSHLAGSWMGCRTILEGWPRPPGSEDLALLGHENENESDPGHLAGPCLHTPGVCMEADESVMLFSTEPLLSF